MSKDGQTERRRERGSHGNARSPAARMAVARMAVAQERTSLLRGLPGYGHYEQAQTLGRNQCLSISFDGDDREAATMSRLASMFSIETTITQKKWQRLVLQTNKNQLLLVTCMYVPTWMHC